MDKDRAGAEGAEAKAKVFNVRFKMLLHLHFEEQGRPTGKIQKVIAEQTWPTDDQTAAIKTALASWKQQNPDKTGVCEVVAIAKNEDIESPHFRRFEEMFKSL